MRPLLVVSLVSLAGCASGGAAPTGSAPTRILDTAGGYEIHIASDTRVPVYTVGVSPDQAMNALAEVYRELEIPIAQRDPATRTIGNPDLPPRRRIAGKLMSHYVDCGHNLTGPIADSYRVQLSVRTTLQPAEDEGSQVLTRIEARARSNEGASGHAVACTSRGRLEEHIANALRDRVGS